MKSENKKPYIYIGYLKIIINRVEPGRYALYHDGNQLILRKSPNGDFTIGAKGRKEIASSGNARNFLFQYFYKRSGDTSITHDEWRAYCKRKYKAMGMENRKGTLVFKDWTEVDE